jgi:hypothetical protein
VGLLKVKVVPVFNVMNTLFELMLVLPDWAKATTPPTTGGLIGSTGFSGIGAGVFDLQIEGCPLQVNPLWILHWTHPGEDELPESHCSLPTISPSPHLGMQTPWVLGVNPVVAQVIHSVADLQVAHDPLQATQPLFESKYCPLEQVIGFICSFWHTP